MARLISLYRDDGHYTLGQRELALPFDENISMVMKLPELNLARYPSCLKSIEQESFVDKKKLLSSSELREALQVSCQEVLELVGPNVPCVGCRRSVERLFHELVDSGRDALYPITINQDETVCLAPEVVNTTSKLFILLKCYGNHLSTMVESITQKSKQTRRCPLHSLDAHRARPVGVQWRPLWDSMAQECKEELTLVEADTLLDTLEAYLQKHRFCPECRLKVLRAYSLLVGEVEPSEEKGYKPLLYRGLKCCPAEKHIHVQCNTDLISLLIARAEPELVGSTRRERHAKTMEVAQEEVVTCVGICLLERLQRVAQRVREEEQMVDMLQYASLQALHRSFEIAVESKRGFSQLELLCEELSREEAAQKKRKEAKKQRRKKKRGKKDSSICPDTLHRSDKDNDDDDDDDDSKEVDCTDPFSPSDDTSSCGRQSVISESSAKTKKNPNVLSNNQLNGDNSLSSSKRLTSVDSSEWEASRSPSLDSCSCAAPHSKHSNCRAPTQVVAQQTLFRATNHKKYIQESGYCSTNSSNLATPEGSDVACTEGLCNHQSGSPVQSRPSPSPVLECSPDEHCKCAGEEISIEQQKITSRCPIHIKLRENCCIGRSLQQMLEEWHVNSDEDEGDEESYIPLEEVQAFRKQQQLYNEQRRQLRNDLRLKFDQLCGRIQSQTD